MNMRLIWQCMFSPRLYKIYRDGPLENTYQPNGLEKWGDRVISAASTILQIGMYTSPFICVYIYKRGFYTWEESKNLARLFGGLSCFIAISFLIRGFGRATNNKYTTFIKTLEAPTRDQKAYLDSIRKYDFDFNAWPVSYAMAPTRKPGWGSPFAKCANPQLPLYQRTIIQVLAFLATHTFGLRLIYPGCLEIINKILWSTLLEGRTNLVEAFDGKRAKIQTADGNFIDTMFVDNRKLSDKGKTLVIGSEGNSGFYEIGVMGTPIKSGYSVLGWNHPGFAGSTGYPYPDQEENAMDAVVQYAINDLGFEPENIVMFGWSIGGYTATWAAVHYPVKALILDATFDDLLPLALNQMPSSWNLLVKEVVRSYVNLDISSLLEGYDGPVLLIRRTEDEIICLRQGELSTNRGNFLVQRLIETRHPELAVSNENSEKPLSKLIALLDTQRMTLERGEITEEYRKYLKLIRKYIHDFKSTHCAPLPDQIFDTIMNKINAENTKKLA